MKHPSDSSALCEALTRQLRELDLDVSPIRLTCMLAYLEALIDANRHINLTRIATMEEGVRLHLVDSLSALPELADAPEGAVLDLGAGGGFPGVPLAMASGRPFVLLDSVAKKGAAVADVLGALECAEPQIEVVSGRAEELARDRPKGFAAVVARAVAPLPSLVELAAPLLVEDGRLVALKGCPDCSERASGTAVAALVGMVEVAWREFQLPQGGEARTVVVYAKRGNPKVKLPRRIGLAQHNPLA